MEANPSSKHPARTNPRRRSPSQSVSLIHPICKSSDSSDGVAKFGPTSTVAKFPPKPSYQKDSSGESSNPEKWFDRSNNNVATAATGIRDDEPPFFLRNSSASVTPPEGVPTKHVRLAHDLPRHREHRPPLERMGSSEDDFRSVIDDLTIQNKKLKRKLRRYEKLHDAHLHQDKLFEVRVHGLSAEKKRALEEILRDFAEKLEDAPELSLQGSGSGLQTSGSRLRGSGGYSSTLNHRLGPHSSSNSTGFGDSGYGSRISSRQNLSTQYGQDPTPASLKKSRSQQQQQQQQQQKPHASMTRQAQETVQSYLHDIPLGLLPQPTTGMSDRAKKKLVVTRLEQIFAGKGAATEGHQQPMQQQRVAHSAARADRKAIEASGKRAKEEGSREAVMMPRFHSDSPRRASGKEAQSEFSRDNMMAISSTPLAEGESSPLEQRPTRPLDLDPFRAQVPEENIEYIRHLGFSPPGVEPECENSDGHGWVYLNVLANMAQLHTINVTPEFVRRAISGCSKRIELSSDGRKVRWKGGSDITTLSTEPSPARERSENKSGKHSDGSRHPSILASHSSGSNPDQTEAMAQKYPNVGYSPLFAHKQSSEADELDRDDSSTCFLSGSRQALPSRTPKMKLVGQHGRDEGPIIFYQKANFCTDLSGDPNIQPGTNSLYACASTTPMGKSSSASSQNDLVDSKGPLSRPNLDLSSAGYAPSDLDSLQVNAGAFKSDGTPSTETSAEPFEFEASGLGQIYPTDNFSISVRTRQIPNAPRSTLSPARISTPNPAQVTGASSPARASRLKSYPHNIRKALLGSSHPSPRPTFTQEIVTRRIRELPASVLPPPSFYPMDSPSDEDDDHDTDEQYPIRNPIRHAQTAGLTGSIDSDENYDSDDSMDVCSDGSRSRPVLPSTVPSHPHAAIAAALRGPLAMMHGTESFTRRGMSAPNIASSMDGNDISEAESDGGNSSDNEDNDDGKSEDDEVNFLGDARMANHAMVRAKEREYIADRANRWAHDIPAGSSAATAEGGSGFSSPAFASHFLPKQTVSGVGEDSRERLKRLRGADAEKTREKEMGSQRGRETLAGEAGGEMIASAAPPPRGTSGGSKRRRTLTSDDDSMVVQGGRATKSPKLEELTPTAGADGGTATEMDVEVQV